MTGANLTFLSQHAAHFCPIIYAVELKRKILIVAAHGRLYQPTGMEQIIEENLCVILLKAFLIARFLIFPHLLQGGTYVSISEVHDSPSYEGLSKIIKVKGFKKSLYVAHQRERIDLISL